MKKFWETRLRASLIGLACAYPWHVVADIQPFAPDEDVDYNLVSCFASASDADLQVIGDLRSGCFERAFSFCYAKLDQPEKTRGCIIHEIQLVSAVLDTSISLLPKESEIQEEPFYLEWRLPWRYPDLLSHLNAVSISLALPLDHLDLRQLIDTFGDANDALLTLFYLAEETHTELPLNDPIFEQYE